VLDETAPFDETLILKEGTVQPDGTLKEKGNALPISAFQPDTTERGFTLTIPKAYKNTPLILTFKTRLMEIIGSGNQPISNTISLWRNGAEIVVNEDATKKDTVINSNTAEGYANGTGLKYLKAASFYTSNPSIKDPKTANQLTGLELILNQMEVQNGAWIEEPAKKKTRISSNTAVSTFLRIYPDTLYKIQQEDPKRAGIPGYKEYTLLTQPQYVIFTDRTDITYPKEAIKGQNLYVLPANTKTEQLNFFNSDNCALYIRKTSDGSKLDGFSFLVKGNKGYSKEFVTNAKGEIDITNIPKDEYTISEVENDATIPYIIPGSQTVNLAAVGEKTINMYNLLRRGSIKVVKTSDDGVIEGFNFILKDSKGN
ncbi:MAG: hypothetical protein RR237_06270, partial [Acetivibrio sp.]